MGLTKSDAHVTYLNIMIKNNLVYLTKELIKFKTVRPDINNPGKEKSLLFFRDELNSCFKFIKQQLHPSLIIEERENKYPEPLAPFLIAKTYETREPDLLIVGHVDVVDGNYDQFCPDEKEGKIYGRGAKDMKSGIAAMIEIINHFAALPARANIAVVFVSDEENGGYNGANLVVNELGYMPKSVLTPDPGERHCLINREKGLICFECIVYGKSAHPSRPWLGINAVELGMQVWKKICEKYNQSFSEDDWRTSACLLEVSRISIEDGIVLPDNSASVPGLILLKGDIRFTENENIDNIINDIISIITSFDVRNQFTLLRAGPVCSTPPDHPFLINFKKAVDTTENNSLDICSSAGASDARFFSAKKIPCINFGPHGKNHHANNEYVEIESILKFYNTVVNYIETNLL